MEFFLTYLSCPERQLPEYLKLINESVPDELSLTTLANSDRFAKLKDLFSTGALEVLLGRTRNAHL